ncbi:hypothetical protein Bca4012_037708 [Brassica carinata]
MCSVKTAYLTNSEEFCASRKLLELKLEPSKTSDSLAPLELSNSGFMHLSLPKSFDPGIRQGDGQPKNAERLKESHGQHLTCPQNVEEDTRNNKRTQAVKEQIILQLAETIWEQRLKIP